MFIIIINFVIFSISVFTHVTLCNDFLSGYFTLDSLLNAAHDTQIHFVAVTDIVNNINSTTNENLPYLKKIIIFLKEQMANDYSNINSELFENRTRHNVFAKVDYINWIFGRLSVKLIKDFISL